MYVNKTEVNNILKGIKAQLNKGKDISDIDDLGFSYIGDSTITNDEVIFEGRVKRIVSAQLSEDVSKVMITEGLSILHYTEDGYNELQAFILVKAYTQYDVEECYITIATLSL